MKTDSLVDKRSRFSHPTLSNMKAIEGFFNYKSHEIHELVPQDELYGV